MIDMTTRTWLIRSKNQLNTVRDVRDGVFRCQALTFADFSLPICHTGAPICHTGMVKCPLHSGDLQWCHKWRPKCVRLKCPSLDCGVYSGDHPILCNMANLSQWLHQVCQHKTTVDSFFRSFLVSVFRKMQLTIRIRCLFIEIVLTVLEHVEDVLLVLQSKHMIQCFLNDKSNMQKPDPDYDYFSSSLQNKVDSTQVD